MKTHYKKTLVWIGFTWAIALLNFTVSFAQSNVDNKGSIHIVKKMNGQAETFDTSPITHGNPDFRALTSDEDGQFPFPERLPDPLPNPDTLPFAIPDLYQYTFYYKNYLKEGVNKSVDMKGPGMLINSNEYPPLPEMEVEKDGYKEFVYKHITLSEKNNSIEPAVKNEVLQLNNLKIYPNPCEGPFRVNFHLDVKGDLIIRLTDIVGKEILLQKHEDFSGDYNNQFDLSDKGKGIYLLSIEQNKKMITKRIMIN